MLTLMREGGVQMFFILLFGLIGLAVSIRCAWLAETKSLGFVRWMMWALGFATLNGTAADIGATLHYVANHPGPNWHEAMIVGLGESTSPAILGFGMLAVISVIVAVGQRRIDARAQ
jgi:hypothetical protein